MRKRLLAQILALCMVLSLLPVSVFAEDEEAGQIEQDGQAGQVEQDEQEDLPAAIGSAQAAFGEDVKNGTITAGSEFTVVVDDFRDSEGNPLSLDAIARIQVFAAVTENSYHPSAGKDILIATLVRGDFAEESGPVAVPISGGNQGFFTEADKYQIKVQVYTESGCFEADFSDGNSILTVTGGAPVGLVFTATSADLVIKEDGVLGKRDQAIPFIHIGVWDEYYNRTKVTENVTVTAAKFDNDTSGWTLGGTPTAVITPSADAVFEKLTVTSENGRAVKNAYIQFSAGNYGRIVAAPFSIPGAVAAAGSADFELRITDARDANYALLSGEKTVTVTDTTGDSNNVVFTGKAAFSNGAAAVTLDQFDASAYGERTLTVQIDDIYQNIPARITLKHQLTAAGLLKPGGEGADPAAVTGSDIAKTYDGTKSVPAALYQDWTVEFKNESNEAVTLKKGTDYRITSVEFAGKDAGTQAVTAVVQILNSADTKDYSLTGDGRITIPGASIAPKEITVKTAKAENKTYDGSTSAAVNVTFDGLAAGERLSADDYTVTANFDTKDAGRAKPVNYTIALNAEGTAKNYTLKTGEDVKLPEAKADITAVTLTPSVSFGIDNSGAAGGTLPTEIAAGTKLTTNVSVAGAVGSESPVLAYAWTVNGKAAAADEGTPNVYTVKEGDRNITVTVTLAAVDGAANAVNGNYVMASAAKTAAVGSVMIDAASLILPEGGKITKVYDGTTRAALPSGTKVVFKAGSTNLPENVRVNYTVKSVAYTSANAGTHSVTVTVELSGGNGSYVLNNGTFTFTDAAGVDITKASVPAPAKSLRVAVDAAQTITLRTDGAVSARIDDETKATVSVKDNVITVNGVATGSAKLTISAAAGENYNALADTEVAVTVTAKGTGSSGGSGGSSSGGNSSDNNSNNNWTSTDSSIYGGYTGGTVTVRSTAYIDNGSAVVSVGSGDAQSMVREAAQNNSSNVTVIAEIPAGQSAGTVRAELPASAVSDLYNRTNASLTVETPIASVVIPNASLYQLGSGSGSVSVVTTRNSANTVSVSVQRNGYSVSSLSSGMKVEIPVTSVAANSGVVAVQVNSNGSETVLPKSVVDGYDLTVLLDSGSATIRYRNNAKSFSDVSGTYWANDAIDFVSSHNLFIGTTNTTFGGYATMNRAMLVTVLHRLESTPGAGSYSFADVPYNSYYAQAASWASSHGIVQGDGSGFSGSRAVTREEMAVMLYRYVKTINGNQGEMSSYSNMAGANQVSGWASEAMRWAVGSGIIQGDNTGNLRPQSSATRAEVAQMLMNFVELITQ